MHFHSRSRLTFILILFGAVGCHRQEEVASLPPTEEARWHADSAAYVERLEKWRHDSLVIDSIARTVNTDSLRALYRAVWSLPQPAAAFQELLCEQSRLNARYGALAATIAGEQVKREVW